VAHSVLPVRLSRMGSLRSQRGIALLMVLAVVTLLAALVVSFTDSTQKHLALTAHQKNRLQAYWTAQAGIQLAVQALSLSGQAGKSYDGIDSACWHCESRCYQELVAPRLLVPLPETASYIEPALPVDTTLVKASAETAPAVLRCPIVDENRKLSLFSLVENAGTSREKTSEEVFLRLVYLLQYVLTEEDLLPPEAEAEGTSGGVSRSGAAADRISLADAEKLAGYLVDWVDGENTAQGTLNPDSAEDACPSDGKPYLAKNGLLDSSEEIAMVCGFRQMPRKAIHKLLRHLTAYSLQTNINTATLAVLHAFCAQAYAAPGGLGNPDETDSERIYANLHPAGTDSSPVAIQNIAEFDAVLKDWVSSPQVAQKLKTSMGVKSTCFRLGFFGLVRDPETGSEEARARVEMVLDQAQSSLQGPKLLYYRED
jgi:hypothetical protein